LSSCPLVLLSSCPLLPPNATTHPAQPHPTGGYLQTGTGVTQITSRVAANMRAGACQTVAAGLTAATALTET
jgi:hypothetical protein